MVLPQFVELWQEHGLLAGLVVLMLRGPVRNDLRIRVGIQDVQDKGRRHGSLSVVHGGGDVVDAALRIFPEMDRGIHQLPLVVVHSFTDGVSEAGPEGIELPVRQTLDGDAFTAENRKARLAGLRDHMGGAFHPVFHRRAYPGKPLVGSRSPEIVAFLHISPEPVQHPGGDAGRKCCFWEGISYPFSMALSFSSNRGRSGDGFAGGV